MSYYDTTRDMFTDDLADLNEILDALRGAGPELPEKVVITRLAQTLKHVLAYIERQRRER